MAYLNQYFTPQYFAPTYFTGNGGAPPPGTPEFDIGGPYLHDAFPVSELVMEYDLRKRTE